jgi:hypothetical protein
VGRGVSTSERAERQMSLSCSRLTFAAAKCMHDGYDLCACTVVESFVRADVTYESSSYQAAERRPLTRRAA